MSRGAYSIRVLILLTASSFGMGALPVPKPSADTSLISEGAQSSLDKILEIENPGDPNLALKHWVARYIEASLEDAGEELFQEIRLNIADSLFETNKASVFYHRLDIIQQAYRITVEEDARYRIHFETLDQVLSSRWQELDKRAIKKRIIGAAAGAAVSLIAIPIEFRLWKSLSLQNRWLYLVVPATIAAGAGIGFLGAGLLATRRYQFDSLALDQGLESADTQRLINKLDRLRASE